MGKYTDFPPQGYQIKGELEQNYAPDCAVYEGIEIATQQSVIIEQTSVPEVRQNGEQFIEALKQLNCAGVPEYLNKLVTSEDLALIRKEIPLPSLASQNNFNYQEIKQIATGVLQTLAELQKQPSPLIHRQIQAENILWQNGQVYLVNFSLGVLLQEDSPLNQISQGTFGFNPPEKTLNITWDLYGLGVTIICLLAGKQASEIADIIDETQTINFDFLVPNLNPLFVDWLDRMVSPSMRERYKNAAEALAALQAIDSLAYQEQTPPQQKKVPLIPLAMAACAALIGLIPVSIYGQKFISTNSEQRGLNNTTSLIRKQPTSPPQGEEARKQLLATGECIKCDLAWVDLSQANLEGVNLKGANLEGANLGGANLEDANLVESNLKSAHLENANLINANLRNSNLEIASLFSTNLAGANLSYANLQRANLMSANLKYAEMWQTDVQGAMLPNGVNVSY